MIAFTLAAALSLAPWTPPYRIIDPPTGVTALVRSMGRDDSKIIATRDRLTLLSKGDANRFKLPDWLRLKFTHDVKTGVWVAQLGMEDWDQAFFTYDKGTATFVGPKAPAQPLMATTLKGRIKTVAFDSKALGSLRGVTVYLPPGRHEHLNAVYMMDGDWCEEYARVIEPLILSGSIAPTAIIGLHHGPYLGGSTYDIEKDFRAREYLKQADPDRSEAYTRFLCDEVMPWAEASFGLEPRPRNRTLFGFSNGGAFVTTCVAEHPSLFGSAIACSVAAFDRSDLKATIAGKPLPKLYLASGTLEIFIANTKDVASIYKEGGGWVRFDRYVSGHDVAMWRLAFARDLKQIFPG